ncbi:hypothetical protein [Occallatibacter riparius]|uniref:Uncharacterized protein n=1 Tax=Occallatibacter riparius TaxID=1002689 RepID=A0A9J7BUU0_9BACT|nr:hypothetical protein [Occallatibacter riparius]UWZ86431.1 hypothetical protein MOP44_10910 [Occallatibacter riparius]
MPAFNELVRVSALSLCVIATPVVAQVTITGNEPVNGGTYTLPALISAHATSPQGISGWRVYFGNTSYYSSSTGLGGNLDVTIASVPTGTYKVTVTAWDNGGNNSSYVVQTVNVVASPMPTPPQGTKEYANIQNDSAGSWQPCTSNMIQSNGKPCAGGTSGGTSDLRTGQSPSLSGGSLAEYSDSSGIYYNTMYYNHLGCPGIGCDAVKNMLLDEWMYPKPSPSNGFQQLEFDPDLYDTNGYEYFGSVACDMSGGSSGTWKVWDMGGGQGWISTSRSCTMQPNQWHHLQLYVTYNVTGIGCPNSVPCYTYKTMTWDGATVFQNLGWSYNAKKIASSGNGTLNVEQQIDNYPAQGVNNTVYYDNYNLWVW